MATTSEEGELRARERALQQAYEIIADPGRSFSSQVDALLEVVREAVGTDYAALSRIHDDEYLFESVATPDGATLEAGDTAPLDATNCERVVATEQTLVLKNVAEDAPELADRAGNAEWGISCYLGTPVIVDGEPYGTFCFYDTEARTEEFSEWEVTFVELLGNWVSYELERHRYVDRLAALGELDDVVREVTGAVIDRSTREEIESIACRTLANADSYQFAWIGEANPTSGQVDVRTAAGVESDPDEAAVAVDPDDSATFGPVGQALQSMEIQTAQHVQLDPPSESRRDRAVADGYRSMAAVPIVHAGAVYGVLNVYADRPDAFDGQERSVIEHLGEVLGHAITSVERKQALTSDTVVELRFRIENAFDHLGVSVTPDETVILDELVETGDDEFILYGTTSEAGVTALSEIAADTRHWTEVSRIGERAESVAFKIRLSEPPLLSVIASSGGMLENMVIEDGGLQATVYLPPEADVRRVTDALRDVFPTTSIVSKRQIARPRPDTAYQQGRETLANDLTERQRQVLRTAYREGYFEWPRDASAEEVAESLDVSSPTLHQHLRAAENKLFDALLDGSPETDSG